MRVVFIGTGEIGLPSLQALLESKNVSVSAVVTQPDKPVGRSQKVTASPVKTLAFKYHLPIYQPEDINVPAVAAQLKYLKPDVFVVCAYGQILKKQVLGLPAKACLNIHASLLPKYRGASCIQGALLNGDRTTGITVIWMDEGLDTGDVLVQDTLSIGRRETAGTLHDRLAALAPSVLLKGLDLIARGKAARTKQDPAKASYVKKLSKENGHIDWSRPQMAIDRHIRAMTPWPSAYSWIPEQGDQKMLKIFGTIISKRAKGKPGEVVRVDKHGILVAAGEGGLLLREVQIEGRKRMHAAEFARGYNLPVGMILE
jgi:methionyl-tRNA formyltransferase